MKVSSSEDVAFQPIVISITIDSEDELLSMYHRMNMSGPRVAQQAANAGPLFRIPDHLSMAMVYRHVKDLLQQRGVK